MGYSRAKIMVAPRKRFVRRSYLRRSDRNEGDAVRLARPKGKKYRLQKKAKRIASINISIENRED